MRVVDPASALRREEMRQNRNDKESIAELPECQNKVFDNTWLGDESYVHFYEP